MSSHQRPRNPGLTSLLYPHRLPDRLLQLHLPRRQSTATTMRKRERPPLSLVLRQQREIRGQWQSRLLPTHSPDICRPPQPPPQVVTAIHRGAEGAVGLEITGVRHFPGGGVGAKAVPAGVSPRTGGEGGREGPPPRNPAVGGGPERGGQASLERGRRLAGGTTPPRPLLAPRPVGGEEPRHCHVLGQGRGRCHPSRQGSGPGAGAGLGVHPGVCHRLMRGAACPLPPHVGPRRPGVAEEKEGNGIEGPAAAEAGGPRW